MRDQHLTSRWLGMFPELLTLDEEHRAEMLAAVQVKRLSEGDVAYYHGQICEAYLMCIEGRTRVFKTSESGREILLYQVGPGETCVLTTSCLMAGRSFPAESTAESDVILVALPAPVFHRLMKTSAEFRQFVMGNYGELLTSLITLVEEVAFTSLDQRLARRLLAETDDEGIVSTTHQQLASDLGSVREVISRYLDEWERMGWVHASRGSIKVLDRSALSNYSNGREEYPSRPHRHHAG
jgi:CRP/FNR family transcriptional regulator, anaerobic regulatory protein